MRSAEGGKLRVEEIDICADFPSVTSINGWGRNGQPSVSTTDPTHSLRLFIGTQG